MSGMNRVKQVLDGLFYGVTLPRDAVFDRTLARNDLAVLAVVSRASNDLEPCYLTNQAMAEQASLNPAVTARSIAKLVKAGHLKRWHGQDRFQRDIRCLAVVWKRPADAEGGLT